MLTIEEFRTFPIFASLTPVQLQRLTETAADIHLEPGEFAVPEGGERALYAVISGRLEVIKIIDGVERRLGWRVPGTIFGEVPLALGTPFPGGYRASEPSRVMRVEASQYYSLAASSPELATKMGALARERLGGLQVIAAEPPKARLTLVGHRLDPACGEMRRFLTRNQISFEWFTPESPQLGTKWPGSPPTEQDCPAIRLLDGTAVHRPSTRRIAQLVNLQTSPRCAAYDTVVIGGGPAGLAAAVYGASEGLRTIVVEREAPGGQAGTSSRIENYLGFPNGVSGDELAARALNQACRLGAEILVTRSVLDIDTRKMEVVLDGEERIGARTVILATGVAWRRVAIEGADRLIGKGVYYGAARSEATATNGLDIHLIGAGNSAGQAALYFANHARSVTLIARGISLERSMSHYLIEQVRRKANIEILLNSEVIAVQGNETLTAIDIRDFGCKQVRRVSSGGLFVFIGADAETGWLPAEIARDLRGYVLTGDDVIRANRWSLERDPFLLETSVPGIFACGDVRLSTVKRVAAAVGEGSMSIAFVHQFLQKTSTSHDKMRGGGSTIELPGS
jgi:thioredoxin reductase (NADPH)